MSCFIFTINFLVEEMSGLEVMLSIAFAYSYTIYRYRITEKNEKIKWFYVESV